MAYPPPWGYHLSWTGGFAEGVAYPSRSHALASKFWQFVKELKRRRVLPFAAGYGLAAVGSIEIARVLLEALGFHRIVWTILATILLLGFPLVLFMGQVLEVTPEEPLVRTPVSRRSNRWILPGIGLVVSLLAMYFLVIRRG